MMCRRHSSGFTLIELIIVLGLMGMATTLGMTMLYRVSDAWRQTSRRTELNARADEIIKQMQKDFAEVVSSRLAGVSVHGTSKTGQDSRFFKVLLEDDEVVIPVEIVAGPGGPLQRANVRYRIERQDGGSTLMRVTRALGDEKAPVTTVKVADGVLAMRIEYLGKGPDASWQNDWANPAAPAAVRVSVTLADPDRYAAEQISRKAVFPIRVD
jgi:prepilin-type N-terminal cleavage/methylation domain-containing protein